LKQPLYQAGLVACLPAVLPEKFNQSRIDLAGAFLQNPVAGALDDEFLLEVRQDPLHVGHALAAHQAGDHSIV